MSSLSDLRGILPQQIWEGVLGRVVHGEYLTFGVIELAADTVVPEHSHANEQLGIVLEGSLTFRVEDEIRELRPGGIWQISSNVPHEVHAGPHGAILIDVFAPSRDDWKKLGHQEIQPPRWPQGD